MSDTNNPAAIIGGMRSIEDQLEAMLVDWARAEEELVRHEGRIARRAAELQIQLKGKGTIPDIKAEIEITLWNEFEVEMAGRLNCEAVIAACKTKYKLLEKSLSSKQSRLATERDLMKIPTRP